MAATDTREIWQIRQGAVCSCRGFDDMCPCQNVEQGAPQRSSAMGERDNALHNARPSDAWHEDVGSVLWFLDPISEPPYCGTPLDLGATWSLNIYDGIGRVVGEREDHRFQVGGWPFTEDHEPRLWWTPLPDMNRVQASISTNPIRPGLASCGERASGDIQPSPAGAQPSEVPHNG